MSGSSTQPQDKSTMLSGVPAISVLACLALGYTLLLGQFPTFKVLSDTNGISWCLFKQLCHLPCIFCGFTRSFTLIGQGHFLQSIAYHPLGMPAYALTVVVALIGPIKPAFIEHLLGMIGKKCWLTVGFSLLLICWIWKLGHSPQFW